jgi:hypothetical protein
MPEFRQAFGGLLACRGLIIAGQDGTQNLSMFRLGRAAMLRRPHAQTTDHVIFEVPNRQGGHAGTPSAVNAAVDSM